MAVHVPRPRALGLAVACLGAIGLMVLFAVLPLQAWFGSLASRLTGLGAVGVCLFAFAYVVAVMAFVPASVLSLVSGLTYGPGGLVLSWCCMMTVAVLTRPLARRWLAPVVHGFVGRRRKLSAVMAVIEEEGWRMVLLVRISGIVPFGLQNHLLGVARLRTVPYLLATAVGVIPSILLYGGAGFLERRALTEGIDHPGALAIPALAVLAGMALVATTAHKVRQKLSVGS